jgi:hypothetical protein
MKLRLFLGLVLSGLLCGCGSSNQGNQTAAPNSSHRIGAAAVDSARDSTSEISLGVALSVLVRFNDVASFIINVDHSAMSGRILHAIQALE